MGILKPNTTKQSVVKDKSNSSQLDNDTNNNINTNDTVYNDTNIFQTTEEENNALEEFSEKNDKTVDEPVVKTKSVEQAMAEIKKDNHATFNSMLLYELSPQLRKNEIQKRHFKQQITNYIIVILSIQLGFFLLIVLLFSMAFCFKFPFLNNISNNQQQLETITAFYKYYITAIIAEFLAMLFFIVRFVFDKSIVTLVRDLFNKND